MSHDIREQVTNLQNAIAALEAQRQTLGEAVVEASIAALNKQLADLRSRSGEQQRRLVTVLSLDIVGSTQLGHHFEPEDYLEIMDGALQRLSAHVESHGGHILRFMGDGFLALFGFPTSHENDAEMAVRAGLEILKEAQTIAGEVRENWNVSGFEVRVGVNTGMVAIGGYSEAENTVMGLPVNLGVRLETAAPPGGILISHTTLQQVRGLFEVEPVAPILAKGFTEPIQVYQVKSAAPPLFRPRSRGVEGVETRMIGREAELKILQDVFYAAVEDREPQLVTVTGEPGIGKSRLLYEFENWIAQNALDVRLFRARSRPEMQNAPYSLLRDLFAFRFHIQEDDRAGVMAQKLEEGIGEAFVVDGEGQMRAHFIGQLLGFEFSSPHLEGVAADARQLRDRAQVYLEEYFLSTSRDTPTLFLLEDIHWSDDSSLDFIAHLAQVVEKQPLMILCLARPVLFERRPFWGEGHKFQTRLNLRPLTSRESRRLVEEILRKLDQIPLMLRELVVERAEGNPFYIEELIKMLIERGIILPGEDAWQIDPTQMSAALAGDVIPTSLTGVLQARLDSLPPAERTILQQASVVGRIFWDESLRYLLERSKKSQKSVDVREALDNLRQKEMIFRREASTFTGAQEYIFKHAILRDVTYSSMVRRVRQNYHALAAEWLIEKGGDRAGELTSVIAEHLQLAGHTRRAVAYLRQAGERAASRYANEEALKYLSRALELLTEGDTAERFDLLKAREQVYSLLGAREKQQKDLRELVKLGQNLDDTQRGEVALLEATYASERSDYPAIIRHAQEGIQLGRSTGTPRLEARGHLLWGRALVSKGDYPGAQEHFEEALSLARECSLPGLEADSLRYLGIIGERLGEPDRARRFLEESLEIFRRIGDRRGEGLAINSLGNILLFQGDYARGREYYERFLDISREIGDRWGEGSVILDMGDVFLKQSEFTTAGGYFEQALQISREIGNRTIESSALVGMGNVYLQKFEFTQAKTHFEGSLQIARDIGNKPWEAKSLAELGHFFCILGETAKAASYYEQALELFRALGNHLGESQALTDLSYVYHRLGDNDKASAAARLAYEIATEIDQPRQAGLALTQLGHALHGLGQQAEAAQAYEKAVAVFQPLEEPDLALEALAGQANLLLALGDLEQAHQLADQVLLGLERLSSAPASPGLPHKWVVDPDQISEPLWLYLVCFRVLKASRSPRAGEILEAAHRALQEGAARIDDPGMRESVLKNVATNQEIIREYELWRGEGNSPPPEGGTVPKGKRKR